MNVYSNLLLLVTIFVLSNCSSISDKAVQREKLTQDRLSQTYEAICHPNCLEHCPVNLTDNHVFVDHEAIVLSSNKITKFADWVAYKIATSNMKGPPRPRNWKQDPKLDKNITLIPSDYKRLSQPPYNFDRGHQAPLAAFTNHPQWYVVNYLSNITPQKKYLNQGPWNALESQERKLAQHYENIFVLTGPYYDRDSSVAESPNERISYIIPSGYWKIISIVQNNKVYSVAFLFPQNTPQRDKFCRYLTSIPNIEKISHLKVANSNQPEASLKLLKKIGCTK